MKLLATAARIKAPTMGRRGVMRSLVEVNQGWINSDFLYRFPGNIRPVGSGCGTAKNEAVKWRFYPVNPFK